MSRTYKDRPYRVAARQDRGPVHEWHRGCEQADPVYRRRTVVTESAPHWHEEELTVHGRPAWAYEDFDSWRLVDADGFFDAEAFEDYSDWVTTETVRRWMFGPTTEVVTDDRSSGVGPFGGGWWD